MKLEEISEEIQKLQKYANLLRSPDEFFRHMNGHKTELSLVLSAFTIAKESGSILSALEKQTPKKPNLEGDGYDNEGNIIYDTWLCPNCGAHYEIDYDDYNHCPICGQRVDLSDVN